MVARSMLSLALLVVATACSGDSDPSVSSTTQRTEPTSEDTEDTEDTSKIDQETADGAVLALDDLPSGWEKQPESTDEDREQEEKLDRAFAECLGIDPSELEEDGPKAESSFANTDDEEITSEVSFRPSEDEAQEDLDRVKSEEARACYEEILGDFIAEQALTSGEDVEVGDVTFNEVSHEDLGDDSVAYRMTAPLSQDGIEVEVFLDLVAIVKGRAGVTMTFTSYFSPFDEELALELTELVVDRVRTVS